MYRHILTANSLLPTTLQVVCEGCLYVDDTNITACHLDWSIIDKDGKRVLNTRSPLPVLLHHLYLLGIIDGHRLQFSFIK